MKEHCPEQIVVRNIDQVYQPNRVTIAYLRNLNVTKMTFTRAVLNWLINSLYKSAPTNPYSLCIKGIQSVLEPIEGNTCVYLLLDKLN